MAQSARRTASSARPDPSLTLLPFFIRAVVESLAAFPLMNAKFVPAAGSNQASIYVNNEVNIGVAIGLPANLIVPVIRQADKLSIKGLAHRSRRA